MKEQHQLRVDPIACTGHGICAELLPELIRLDDWGYPIIDGRSIERDLEPEVRRTIAACPTLALRTESMSGPTPLIRQPEVQPTANTG